MGNPIVHPTGAFVVVWTSSRQILLVRQTYADAGYSLPGGRVEPGETGEEAAVREVREETGLIVVLYRELGANLQFTKGDDVFPVRLFEGYNTGGHLRPDNIEVSACEWHDPRNLPAETYPAQRKLIQRAWRARQDREETES